MYATVNLYIVCSITMHTKTLNSNLRRNMNSSELYGETGLSVVDVKYSA